MQVANVVLGGSLDDCGLEAADINGDGTVNILDIVTIANVILGNRGIDATSATLEKINNSLLLEAN